MMRANLEAWQRAAALAVGATLLSWAYRRRTARAPTAALGMLLCVQGLRGYSPVRGIGGRSRRRDDTRRALGGSRGVKLDEGITIGRAPAELFERWTRLDDLPRLIPHLRAVERLDERRSRWTMRGPAGVTVAWDAEVINEIEPRLIAWRSLPGADVASAGSVRFTPEGDHGTRMQVTLQFDAPAGKLGAWVAWLAGSAPDRRLREGLLAFKDAVEEGVSPATTQ
jgi:uncharacterized membrane protein